MKNTVKQRSDKVEDLLDAGRERSIQDDTGRMWTVSERKASIKDVDRSASLLFVSDYSVRRVRDYPPHWFELSNADLFAVSMGR